MLNRIGSSHSLNKCKAIELRSLSWVGNVARVVKVQISTGRNASSLLI
jgi:hypothetical protein